MDMDAAYREHAQAVYAYALSLCHDAHLAQDLTEDTFLRAMRTLIQWKGDCALLTWLCAITRRLFADVCKRRARQGREPPGEALPQCAELALLMLALFLLYALVLHPALYGAHYTVPFANLVPESVAMTQPGGIPSLSIGLTEPVYSQLGGAYWLSPDGAQENGVVPHMRWSISRASHLRSMLHLTDDVEIPYTGEVRLPSLARATGGAYGDDAVLTAIWYDEGEVGTDDLSQAHLLWQAGADDEPLTLGALRALAGE